MNLSDAPAIFAFSRESHRELVYSGFYAIRRGERVWGSGATSTIISRSLLKPWQFLSLGLVPTDPRWLLAIASHSGEAQHIKALKSLSLEHNIAIDSLSCPTSLPMGKAAHERCLRNGEEPAKIYHPCAGKHLAYAIAARAQGLGNELSPLQERLAASLKLELRGPHRWLQDSCGLPTLLASMPELLGMWQRLSADQRPAARALLALWQSEPALVGGEDRLETLIMRASNGRILAKEGADGLLVIQDSQGPEAERYGILIKLSHGYNTAHLGLALLAVLRASPQVKASVLTDLQAVLEASAPTWIPAGVSFEALVKEDEMSWRS